MTHVGIIGAGGISRAHAPGWLAHASRITICSLEGSQDLAAHLEELAARTWSQTTSPAPQIEICPDLDRVLDTVDVVDICTPTDTHADLARQALEHGRHVLCEKPLTRYPEQAEALITLAASTGRVLYPAHVVRFFPAYVQARQAVADGTLGRLAVARYRRMGSFPSWSSWFADESRSGGLVTDLMIHDLDQAAWIGGPVTSVFATLDHHDADGGLPVEVATATLTHSDGVLSQVQAVWGPPGMEFRTDFHLAGTDGTLRYSSEQDAAIRTNGGPTGTSIVPQTAGRSPYTLEIEDFLACVADPGHQPVVTSADGLTALRLAQAVTASVRSGAPVSLATMASHRSGQDPQQASIPSAPSRKERP